MFCPSMNVLYAHSILQGPPVVLPIVQAVSEIAIIITPALRVGGTRYVPRRNSLASTFKGPQSLLPGDREET